MRGQIGERGSTRGRNQEQQVHWASGRCEQFHRKTRDARRPLSETSETGTEKTKSLTCPRILPSL